MSDIHEIANDFGSGIAPLKNMVELPFSKMKEYGYNEENRL